MDKILNLLEDDATLTAAQLAVMLDKEEGDVKKIIEKYGEFYGTSTNDDGEITYGVYMIRDNTPEWIMSYDDSLWYEIYFEEGKAVKVDLREGYIGG